MKDHEIVLKRDKKLAEIRKAIIGPSYTNTRKENIDPDLFHTILHPETNNRGGALCHQMRR